MVRNLRFSMCNEAFEKTEFPGVCRTMRAAGFSGIEIAPFTLSESPGELTAERRRELTGIMHSEGLEFVGLHWLMVSPPGLHVTTGDAALRARSWRHIRDLIDLCADLGPGGVMVFGSPKQRSTVPGVTREDATRRYRQGLAEVASQAEQRGVTILVEALPAGQSDVVNSLAEAVAIVEAIGSPAVQTMFDTHNAVDEHDPHAALVEQYWHYIRHIHVNETDGRHPGTGDYDFKPLFDVLEARKYGGWVSLEAFDFAPGGERIARETMEYLRTI